MLIRAEINFEIQIVHLRRVLKAPPLKSLDLHFSVIKYHFDQKFKKPSFAILGEYNMFDNKFDQSRTEVCPEIEKINLFACFRAFSNILVALCRVYFGGPRNVRPRI